MAGHPTNPPTVAAEFLGQIFILYHPTAIATGYTPVIHAHTAQIACRFAELVQKIDRRTGQVIEENPSHLKRGEGAVVKFIPIRPLCIEDYAKLPQLGRFAVRDMGQTIAVGIVKEITPRE